MNALLDVHRRLLGTRKSGPGSWKLCATACNAYAVMVVCQIRCSLQAYQTYKLGGKVSELLYSPATYGVDFGSKALLKPRARQAPLMAVVKNTLWLMGGIIEVSLCYPYLHR